MTIVTSDENVNDLVYRPLVTPKPKRVVDVQFATGRITYGDTEHIFPEALAGQIKNLLEAGYQPDGRHEYVCASDEVYMLQRMVKYEEVEENQNG